LSNYADRYTVASPSAAERAHAADASVAAAPPILGPRDVGRAVNDFDLGEGFPHLAGRPGVHPSPQAAHAVVVQNQVPLAGSSTLGQRPTGAML
jgi:hypothetical protein